MPFFESRMLNVKGLTKKNQALLLGTKHFSLRNSQIFQQFHRLLVHLEGVL
jgi:hypothetical protein